MAIFTNRGRGGVFATLGLAGLLGAASVFVQMTRDRWYHTDKPAEQILYVRSVDAMRRMVLSYDAVAADIYWIRALQHFGDERIAVDAGERYELLYPLLDLSTSLDPRFNIAYRFGSLFLAEPPPGGPERPDLAIKLLTKGIKEMPEKWQYYQDAGFIYYFRYKDYETAAEWFRRGSELEGAPWFLKSLAANTLAKGEDRQASRMLYQAIAESADNDYMKKDAIRRLRQLDAMDGIDILRDVVRRYRESVAGAHGGGGRQGSQNPPGGPGTPGVQVLPLSQPLTWQTLVAAGFMRHAPRDPDGFEFTLDPVTGEIKLNIKSTLFPLPTETPEARLALRSAQTPVPWPSPISGLPPMLEHRTSAPPSFVP